MSESENNIAEEVQSKTATLKRAIGQHLSALGKAGVATLPKGTGEFGFELTATEGSQTDSEPVATVGEPDRVASEKSSLSKVAESAPTGRYEEKPRPTVPSGSSQATAPLPENLPAGAYGASLGMQQRKDALEIIRTEVADCTKCDDLCNSRTQTVFGVGTETARLVFVGEGPGADEDRTGVPFVGAAGQLLDKIITACKLSREDVYILNTVKCRPPGNRNPSVTELDNCWGYAERQLEILQPEFICCLGSVAAKRVLKTTQSLGRLRQRFHAYRGSRVIVTYHPAYLLRTESAKRHVWEDMKLLMKEMGVDLSK